MTLVFFLVFFLFSERPLAQDLLRPIPQSFQPILDATTEPRSNASGVFIRRQETRTDNTCGFDKGNASKPRTADPGFACRVDAKNGIWGFCPTTVIAVTDCGLAGACFDDSNCINGCGISDESSITTISCTERQDRFCSFAILTAGPDQLYSYIACAGTPARDILFAAATTTPLRTVTSLTTSSSRPRSSSTPASSTTISSSKTSSNLVPSPSQISTPISSQSSLSSSVSDSASTKTESTPSPARENMEIIVGGTIGGIALICVTILGVFYLRKYRRGHPLPLSKESETARLPTHHNTYAQTAGIFEKDSKVVETEKYAKSRSHPLVELPS